MFLALGIHMSPAFTDLLTVSGKKSGHVRTDKLWDVIPGEVHTKSYEVVHRK